MPKLNFKFLSYLFCNVSFTLQAVDKINQLSYHRGNLFPNKKLLCFDRKGIIFSLFERNWHFSTTHQGSHYQSVRIWTNFITVSLVFDVFFRFLNISLLKESIERKKTITNTKEDLQIVENNYSPYLIETGHIEQE